MFKIANALALTLLLNSCAQFSPKRKLANNEIPKTVKQLVNWETKANAVATRSDATFDLQHYEIPLSILQWDFAKDLDSNVKDSLVFEKNGDLYVRWIINPEDTKWHLQVRDFLISKNLDATPKTFLKAHLTASRSMIAFNPENGSAFSIKVSTNNTGGNWKDKQQTWDDAKQIRNISDWTKDIIKNMETEHLVIMEEPLAMGIEELDQGLIVRSLNDVPEEKHFYLPGFSALHDETGRQIAQLNGSNNPAKFWRDNYAVPMAKAMAEFAAYTGVYYDSPHSQNFMIELDKELKPTGRIVFRDFGDSYLLKNFISQTENQKILEIWEADNIVSNRFPTAVGFLHGNSPPSWLSQDGYKKYGKSFYEAYEKRFSEITGVPVKKLEETKISNGHGFSYMSKNYPATSSSWSKYYKYANCLNGLPTAISGEDCLEFFKAHQKKENCMGAVQSFVQ